MKRYQRRRDWDATIARLNATETGELAIRMGSPGSAQVTRVRLLSRYSGLEAHTEGARILLRLA